MKIQDTKDSEGFTLLELMIGASVLVVALVGLIAAFSGCFTLNETARNTTIAINGAQDRIEWIRNITFDQIANQDGTNFEIDGLPDGDSEGIVEVDSINPDLYRITITISWRQKGGRIFGEDTNLNGAFEAGEDVNENGRLDSPVRLVTLIARR